MTLFLKTLLATSLLAVTTYTYAETYEIFSTEADGSFNQDYTVNDAIDGHFTDTFTFYIDSDSTELNATASDSVTLLGQLFGFNNVDFTSATIDGIDLTITTTSDSSEAEAIDFSLSAGEHTLIITGDVSGSSPYNYNLDLSPIAASVVSSVPEPSTYALMLAGLGLVGFVARRRKAA